MNTLTLSNLIRTLQHSFMIGRLTIDANSLSTGRTITAPDKSGTIAMTSDINTIFLAVLLRDGSTIIAQLNVSPRYIPVLKNDETTLNLSVTLL